jgi:hypothetical protein
MPKLAIGSKTQKALRFIMGLRNALIYNALVQYGFTEAHLRDGIARLTAVTTRRLGTPAPWVQPPRVLRAIDDFENEWFPIARVALEQHFPVIAKEVFLRLVQSTGPEAAITVRTFVSRVRALESGAGVYAVDGAAARALLTERGLTEARIVAVEALLAELGAGTPTPVPQVDTQAIEAEERALWSWYLEWSTIARVAIRDRRHLRALGFLQSRTGADEEAEPADEEAPQLVANNDPTRV